MTVDMYAWSRQLSRVWDWVSQEAGRRSKIEVCVRSRRLIWGVVLSSEGTGTSLLQIYHYRRLGDVYGSCRDAS